jgi:Predicted metal-binding, possibly nucleic acid-binding protein
MPRPPDVRNDSFVDAAALAAAGSRVERTFATSDLPRLAEAGVLDNSEIRSTFHFSEYDGKPAVDGHLAGVVSLLCQRCMGPVKFALDEAFRVLVDETERADEPGGYEPIIAHPTRLDLRWLIEDQALLALPLVAMHAPEECNEQIGQSEEAEESTSGGQQPFRNLRDMMRKR